MPLVLEDGSGSDPTANSYASLAEGTAYAATRLYSTAWTGAATDAVRETALETATRVIDLSVTWAGLRKTETQALGWPRLYVQKQVSLDCAPIYYDDASVPKGIKDATCELAIELLKADRTSDVGSKGIKSLGLGQGALTIDFDPSDAREMIPDLVVLLLRPFGTIITGKGAHFISIVRA